MENRDTGDVGSFVKFGLLRWLVAPSPFSPPHRLGVVWLRLLDHGGTTDGLRIGAHDLDGTAEDDLRPLDSDLYDRLHSAGANDWLTGSLATSGMLPQGTMYFDQALSFADLAPTDRSARIVRRERWFHEAMVAVEPCSLVFVDPGGGVPCDDHVIAPRQSPEERRAYLSELGRLLERGQSVVACHYVDPSEQPPVQAASAMDEVHEALDVQPLATVHAPRDTTRMFVVLPHPRHRSDLEDRLGALQLSRWGDELRLDRWHRERALA